MKTLQPPNQRRNKQMNEPNKLDEQIDKILEWKVGEYYGLYLKRAKREFKALFTEHSKEIRENAYIEAEAEIFKDEITYGKHTIPKDWEKIENVYIWFKAFHKGVKWRGIPGYVYKKPDGSFIAPFRGELLTVIWDCKNEYRETAQLKRNKGEDNETAKQPIYM